MYIPCNKSIFKAKPVKNNEYQLKLFILINSLLSI